MRNFDIVVDSAANLTDEIIDKYDMRVASLTVSIDGKEMESYVKGQSTDETAKNFYAAMREDKPTKTTLVNAEKIINAVLPSFEAGRDVLFVCLSSTISGTCGQAQFAAEELKKSYPDRKMIIFDSYNASLGEGMFAVYAARMGDMGYSLEECAEWMESNKMKMNSVFTVSSLKYLKRGGRISTTLAIAGTILNIKPVLWADEKGRIVSMCNERGRKKALLKLADTFAANVVDSENQTVAITHADCAEDAEALKQMIIERGAKDVLVTMFEICTGSHVGPGTIALFFLGKERGSEKKSSALKKALSIFKKKS